MSILTSLFGATITTPIGYQTLEYDRGKMSRVLPPGKHRLHRGRVIVHVAMRERVITISPQEIVTAESVIVRATMALRVRTTDPVAFAERAADPDTVIYLAAQIALRATVAGASIEDLLRRGDAVDTDAITRATAEAAALVGVEVLAVLVKDIIVPSELRAAAIELVTAKTRGAARLEEARAETAALRALSNAGRMLDASPALAQLRMVQAAPYGSKVVIAIGADGGHGSD